MAGAETVAVDYGSGMAGDVSGDVPGNVPGNVPGDVPGASYEALQATLLTWLVTRRDATRMDTTHVVVVGGL